MAAFTIYTPAVRDFGRSGYNGPEEDGSDKSDKGRSGYNGPEEDDSASSSGRTPLNFKGDDDDKDQGRSGYN